MDTYEFNLKKIYKEPDLLTMILLLIIIIVGMYVIGEYYVGRINHCTTDPLKYAAEKYEKDYGNPFIGSGFFKDATNRSIYITFSKEGVEEARSPVANWYE